MPSGDGNEFDMDAAWSHDGSRIAFIRWEQIPGDDWDVRPIMIYTVADGKVTEIGPRPREIRAMAPNDADSIASLGRGVSSSSSRLTRPRCSPCRARRPGTRSSSTRRPASGRSSTRWSSPGIASNVWQRQALRSAGTTKRPAGNAGGPLVTAGIGG